MTTCPEAAKVVQTWVEQHGIKVLNVAGPRESKDAKIYLAVMELMEATFGAPNCSEM